MVCGIWIFLYQYQVSIKLKITFEFDSEKKILYNLNSFVLKTSLNQQQTHVNKKITQTSWSKIYWVFFNNKAIFFSQRKVCCCPTETFDDFTNVPTRSARYLGCPWLSWSEIKSCMCIPSNISQNSIRDSAISFEGENAMCLIHENRC